MGRAGDVMFVRTVGPLDIPLYLRRALDPRSKDYDALLASLPADDREFVVPNRGEGKRNADFSRSKEDDLDLRLFVWTPQMPDGGPRLTFHVFPTGVASLEATLPAPPLTEREEVEEAIQDEVAAALSMVAGRFCKLMAKVIKGLPDDFADGLDKAYRCDRTDIGWTARCLVISEAERSDPKLQEFLTEWLETTARPDEAAALIAGEIDVSMTWLNYVIVQRDPEETESLFSAARIAQYFYASQSQLNLDAQDALGEVTDKKGVRNLEERLKSFRRRMQLLQILYETQKGFLSRIRRRKFDDFMDVWDFDDLVANGQRIISASTDRIDEIVAKRTERSTSFTDAILFGIALFTIVEVALYFTEYSREMMSRPALGYTDNQLPFTLRFVAAIDADIMVLGGLFATLVLIVFYAIWKRRR